MCVLLTCVDNPKCRFYIYFITFAYMLSRKNFLRALGLAGLAGMVKDLDASPRRKPLVVSTWNFGLAANAAAWKVLQSGGYALDAVEAGVAIPEADPKITSVGYGGYPDRDGRVTLDSCIMDEAWNCGSVACLEHIMHPSAVARRVMDKTPHVMLVGDGALKFALEQGFSKTDLLTPEAEQAWKQWLVKSEYQPEPNWELNHDTIGMLAIDQQQRLCGICTTSGQAWKMHGRVGDSPVIGAGLYVDGEVGAATCSGLGEEMIRSAASHSIVEAMRSGMKPQKACEDVMKRILKKRGNKVRKTQVCFLAVDIHGNVGAYSLLKGFEYAITHDGRNEVLQAPYMLNE